MGSNQNRHGDKKAAREWGSKARKAEAHAKQRAFDARAADDSATSNIIDRQLEIGIDMAADMAEELGFKISPPGKRRKKDTRRWCRGKVGREHDWEFIERSPFLTRYWHEYRCAGCQKKRHDWRR